MKLIKEGKTRSETIKGQNKVNEEKTANKRFRFEAISPAESPVSVVGKSACGQVDRPLRLDLNPRQKNAYRGH
jgi:hypothetical protein